MFCICWPSSKVAPAGLPKGVWTQRCVTSVRDPELRPPGAHISTSGTGLLSGKAGTEMQCRWVVSSSSLGKCTGKYPPGLLCLVLVCCTCRRYSRVRAAGHQHGLHLWALHLRRHPAGPQRDSAAVQRRSTAHSVYKQVCVLDEYCSKKKIYISFRQHTDDTFALIFGAAFREHWIWTAHLRKLSTCCTTTASAALGTV